MHHEIIQNNKKGTTHKRKTRIRKHTTLSHQNATGTRHREIDFFGHLNRVHDVNNVDLSGWRSLDLKRPFQVKDKNKIHYQVLANVLPHLARLSTLGLGRDFHCSLRLAHPDFIATVNRAIHQNASILACQGQFQGYPGHDHAVKQFGHCQDEISHVMDCNRGLLVVQSMLLVAHDDAALSDSAWHAVLLHLSHVAPQQSSMRPLLWHCLPTNLQVAFLAHLIRPHSSSQNNHTTKSHWL